VKFSLPGSLSVTAGNAGNGLATLTIGKPSESLFRCDYRGGASSLHPTASAEVVKGFSYLFVGCVQLNSKSGTGKPIGWKAGKEINTNNIVLHVESGDDQAGPTRIELQPGCKNGKSTNVVDFVSSEETARVRSAFSWKETKPLPEYDSEGRPTLWYGRVYLKTLSENDALDEMLIHHSFHPLFQSELPTGQMAGNYIPRGDGNGILTYVVIPGVTYNLLRYYALTPDDEGNDRTIFDAVEIRPVPVPRARNADGSLSYQALGESGFRYRGLDGTTSALTQQQPLFGSVRRFVTRTVRTVVGGAVDLGAKALAAWNNLVLPTYTVKVDVDVLNLDKAFDTNAPIMRGAGPNAGGEIPLKGAEVVTVYATPFGLLVPFSAKIDDKSVPEDEFFYMFEAFADFIAGQVSGGVNYHTPPGVQRYRQSGNGKLCTSYPCLESNPIRGPSFYDRQSWAMTIFHDAFDGAPTIQGAFQASNGDPWAVTPLGTDKLQFSSIRYGDSCRTSTVYDQTKCDERSSLSGPSLRHWIKNWLQRSSTITESSMMAGLAKTVQVDHGDWCIACELFASHTTGLTTLPSQHGGNRYPASDYWRACQQEPLASWLGPAPSEWLAIDGPTCRPCEESSISPPGSITGACVRCASDQIAYHNQCETCRGPGGKTFDRGNRCSCGPHQIVNDHGNCDDCPVGQIATDFSGLFGQAISCSECGQGSTASATANLCICGPQTVSEPRGQFCTACPPNNIAINNRCVPCPAGNQSIPGQDACKCATHSIPIPGSVECQTCPSGSIAKNGLCIDCPLNQRPSIFGGREFCGCSDPNAPFCVDDSASGICSCSKICPPGTESDFASGICRRGGPLL